MSLDPNIVVDLQHKLNKLKEEHQQLNDEIKQLVTESSSADDIMVQRLKKRKLLIRDQIQKIEALLTPDIIA